MSVRKQGSVHVVQTFTTIGNRESRNLGLL